MNSTSPATLFGGTWTQIKDEFLYCTTSSKTTGGANSVSYTPGGSVGSHTLTTSEIPAHSHTRGSMNITGSFLTYWWNGNTASGAFSYGGHDVVSGPDGYQGAAYGTVDFNASNNWTGSTSSVGGGTGHNHGFTGTKATINTIPKYMTCYAWYRTA